MTYNIQNAIAIVTGANRGIGKTITETLIAQGASKVYAAARNPASLSSLVDHYGEKVVPVELDLTQTDTIKAAAQQASDVTLVVNNAGVLRTATALSEGAIDALKFEMDVNVYGLIRMAQAFAPILERNGGGAFVQLNSVVSLKNFPDFATYGASKAASYSITQALRSMLGGNGIQVVSVHPGPIDTDMAADAGLTQTEPPTVVADAIVEALRAGTFHVFPDSMAKQFGDAYHSFAESIIEAVVAEA